MGVAATSALGGVAGDEDRSAGRMWTGSRTTTDEQRHAHRLQGLLRWMLYQTAPKRGNFNACDVRLTCSFGAYHWSLRSIRFQTATPVVQRRQRQEIACGSSPKKQQRRFPTIFYFAKVFNATIARL